MPIALGLPAGVSKRMNPSVKIPQSTLALPGIANEIESEVSRQSLDAHV